MMILYAAAIIGLLIFILGLADTVRIVLRAWRRGENVLTVLGETITKPKWTGQIVRSLIVLFGLASAGIWAEDFFNAEPVRVVMRIDDPAAVTSDHNRYTLLFTQTLPANQQAAMVSYQQSTSLNRVPAIDCEDLIGYTSNTETYNCFSIYRMVGAAKTVSGEIAYSRGAWIRFEIHNNNHAIPIKIKDIKLVMLPDEIPYDQFSYRWPPELSLTPYTDQAVRTTSAFNALIVRTVNNLNGGFVRWTNVTGQYLEMRDKFDTFQPAENNPEVEALSLYHADFWQLNRDLLILKPEGEIALEGKIWLQTPSAARFNILVSYEEVDSGDFSQLVWNIWRFINLRGIGPHPVCAPICDTQPLDREQSVRIVYNPASENQSQFPLSFQINPSLWQTYSQYLTDDDKKIILPASLSFNGFIISSVYISVPPDIEGWELPAYPLLTAPITGETDLQIIDPFEAMPLYLREEYNIDQLLVRPEIWQDIIPYAMPDQINPLPPIPLVP